MTTIAKLEVHNFIGISAATITPAKPIVLVGGPNGAGKSSLYQAIHLALFDNLPRVDLKRDAAALVRGAASKGGISVDLVGAPWGRHSWTVAMPSRTWAEGEPVDADSSLSMCLDPNAFLALSPEDRTTIVRELSGVEISPSTIAARLAEHGTPPAVVAELSPLLVLGFDKCVAHSKEQAAQARGAWKATTGEAYGSVKAERWTPNALGGLPDAPLGLAEAVDRHAKAVAHQASLVAARKAIADHEAQVAKDKEIAKTVATWREMVASLEPAAGAVVEVPALECPHCSGLLTLDKGALVIYEKPAIKTVKPAAKARAQAELVLAKRDLAAAEAAASRLANPPVLPAPPFELDMNKAAEAVDQAADLLRTINAQQIAYSQAVEAAARVGGQVKAAGEAHQLVQAWEAAAQALSPTGIPSELMAQAMAPMRAALKVACASESVAGWPLPEIADEGGISAWGRPLALLSESEQFRVGLIFAAAIADLSGHKIIAADRADVLEPKGRAELIGWLADLADAGTLEQAWIFMTLKACFQPKDDLPLAAYWVEDGVVA